jgi:hypothetical protein
MVPDGLRNVPVGQVRWIVTEGIAVLGAGGARRLEVRVGPRQSRNEAPAAGAASSSLGGVVIDRVWGLWGSHGDVELCRLGLCGDGRKSVEMEARSTAAAVV